MIVKVQTRVKRKIINAKSGSVVFESPWEKNLVLDQGLNCLARRSGVSNVPASFPSGFFSNIIVGSGTDPVKTLSGAITFTQSGTTITASSSFFTAAMVGALFKYGTGTGGAEYYIVSQTGTAAVVDTSATVSTPTVGAVWFVNQTGLQTLFTPTGTKTYQTSAGSCQTTVSGNVITHKRTFIIPQQGSTYNVNEIGYCSNGVTSNANAACGRLVLSATDVVSTSNFYVVVLEIAFTYTPGTPTAVSNVGTNIDTAGNAMIDSWFGFSYVDSASGGTDNHGGPNSMLDGSTISPLLIFMTATWTQNSTPANGAGPTVTKLNIPSGSAAWAWASLRGVMELSFTQSLSTSGQTLYGVGISNNLTPYAPFNVKFTTPQTAPTGTFQPNTIFRTTYGRDLSN